MSQAFRQSTREDRILRDRIGEDQHRPPRHRGRRREPDQGVARSRNTRRSRPACTSKLPNPEIDFARSPFFVSRTLVAWPKGEEPRRAGVNSLGVGGTNAYVVLEEPPPRPASVPSGRPYQLLTLSARTRAALDALRPGLPST